MITLSLIYAAFTILLAVADAVRIKIAWGLKVNIDHGVSNTLAIVCALTSIILASIIEERSLTLVEMDKYILVLNVFGWPVCGFIRLALYDPLLNFFRVLTKTNPTGRLDYKSDTTSSAVDRFKWWNRLGFWQQRGIALAGWAVIVFIYYKVQ